MILNRLWAACLLVPAALLFDSSPASAEPHNPNAPSAEAVARWGARALPEGVHKKQDGGFVRTICPETNRFHCLARQVLPRSYVPGVSEIRPPRPMAVTSTPQPDGLGPKQIAAAYNLDALPPGTGNIVAVLDSPDYYAASDLAGYRKGYGLPELPVCPAGTNGGLPVPGGTPCFAAIDETGALYTATLAEDTPQGSDFETALDMDMVSAGCPACSIVLVQLTGQHSKEDNGSGDIIAAVAAASKVGAVAISISLGGPESTDPIFGGQGGTDNTGYSTPGHLVFAASGDFGYDTETFCGAFDAGCGDQTLTTPSYPASAPDVISVGGTSLFNAKGAGAYTESVWNDGTANAQDVTTSGCSTEFPALPWQMANTSLPSSSCTKRASADVSAVAAYATSILPPTTLAEALDTDIVIYTTSDPTQGIDGFGGGTEGTSASSPLVAAIFARVGLTTLMTGSLDAGSLGWPYLPAHQAAFNDVTVGTDDVDDVDGGVDTQGSHFGAQCTGKDLVLCQAGKGWDGPTGVGTPNGAKLAVVLGLVDAGPDGGPETTTTTKNGCSCTTVGGGSASGLGAGGLLFGLAAFGARMARRRRSN